MRSARGLRHDSGPHHHRHPARYSAGPPAQLRRRPSRRGGQRLLPPPLHLPEHGRAGGDGVTGPSVPGRTRPDDPMARRHLSHALVLCDHPPDRPCQAASSRRPDQLCQRTGAVHTMQPRQGARALDADPVRPVSGSGLPHYRLGLEQPAWRVRSVSCTPPGRPAGTCRRPATGEPTCHGTPDGGPRPAESHSRVRTL